MEDYLKDISIEDFISQLSLGENAKIFMAVKDLKGNTVKSFEMFKNLFGEMELKGMHDSELGAGVSRCSEDFAKQDEVVITQGRPIQYTTLVDYPEKTTLIEGIKFPIRDSGTGKIVGIGVFGVEVSTTSMSTVFFKCLYGESAAWHKNTDLNSSFEGLSEEQRNKMHELLFWSKKGMKRRWIATRMKVSESYLKKLIIAATKEYGCKNSGELRAMLESGEIHVGIPDGLTIFSGVNISLSEDVPD